MNLQRLFSPRSITVIGVSEDPKKLGSLVYRNIIDAGFAGRVSIVHPSVSTLFGKHVYASVADSPKSDLAVIVTPAPTVNAILTECGKKGIPNAIVISAGFRESGPEGAAREKELQRIAKRYRMNIIGPNCLGVIHGERKLNASFAEPLRTSGDTVLVSQSGAMAVAITDWARSQGVHIRSLVSLGNKAVIAEHHLLEYLIHDPKTKRVLMYLESIADGKRLLAIARRITKKIPVVVLFAGGSALAKQASSSHTGAISTKRSIVIAALRSAGVVTVDSIEELFDAATAFSHATVPGGKRLAIVSNAGGPGIMALDALANTTLTPLAFSSDTVAKLRAVLPQAAAVGPLVDVLGDADAKRYNNALSAIAASKSADAIAVILTAQVGTDAAAVADVLISIARKFPHLTIVASFVGGAAVAKARKRLAEGNIAHFNVPEDAVHAVALLQQYNEAQGKGRGGTTLKPKPSAVPIRSVKGVLLPTASARVLQRYSFTSAPSVLCRTSTDIHTDIQKAAKRFGFPLVLKLMHPEVIHKARSHALWAGITNAKSLTAASRSALAALSRLPSNPSAGVLVQAHIIGMREWFLGGVNDATFGPVIICARGGTFVEEEGRVCTMLATKDAASIKNMLLASHLGPILTSAVGKGDLPHLIKAIQNLGQCLADHPEIQSIDINPFLTKGNEVKPLIIDARIVV